MDIEQLWEKAREKTEIIRGRVRPLATFAHTKVPYIFLAESSINEGDTVIRTGKVIVEKPMIILPDDMPQFEGFDFKEDLDVEDSFVQTFFLMRGLRFPSLKFNNTIDKLDLDEDSLSKCVDKYKKKMEREENVSTALVLGPEDCWQFSILMYVASLIGRCAGSDIRNLMEKLNKE